MNIFELFAILTLNSDQYNKGIDDAKEKAGGIGSALSTAAKVGGAALAAAGAAAGKLVKDAVESYANYEQLVGGVETLFKESAGVVQEYAANAYKTAGLSANEYMETVTSFSASLLQSLGGNTKKAAEVADMAITDMSDNANKMGTSMESIQNAYQGFAKQNYTMLDNLKLGYGGTKEEMERLLADAEKFAGVKYDISNLNDVYEAIHVVQTELGITGTTAKEASETISGSLAAMKSAWNNLITGVADDTQDFDKLMDNFVTSAENAARNLLPRIEKALQGVGKLVEGLAPVIADALPGLVQNVIPSLVKSAVEIINAFVDALGDEENLDALLNGALTIVMTLLNAISENVEKFIDVAVRIILTLAEFLTDPKTIDALIDAGIKICEAIGRGIIAAIPNIIDGLWKVLENILYLIGEWEVKLGEALLELLQKAWDAATRSVEKAFQAVGRAFQKMWDSAKRWVEKFFNIGYEIVEGIWNGIKRAWDWLVEQWNKLWDNLLGGVKNLLGIHSPSKKFAEIGKYMALGVGEGWDKSFAEVKKSIDNSFDFGNATVGISAIGYDFGEKPVYDGGGAKKSVIHTQTADTSNQPLNITLTMDGATLAHVLFDPMKRENQLRGGAFA